MADIMDRTETPEDTPEEAPGAGVQEVLDSCTLGELEALEQMCGIPVDQFMDPTQPKLRLVRAVVTTIKRRTDPAYTYDDTADMRMDEVEGALASATPTEGPVHG